MGDSTSDDDYVSRIVPGSGKFRKFMASEDEGSIPSLADVQHLEDPNEEVKFGCFRVKRAVKHELVVAVLMLIVIAAGAGNSVTSRIKGQAMGPFNFFTSLGNSIMYVISLPPRPALERSRQEKVPSFGGLSCLLPFVWLGTD